ncbi:hypothetical protein HDK77DRAFT_64955 [Phyllosticta capitalensis]
MPLLSFILAMPQRVVYTSRRVNASQSASEWTPIGALPCSDPSHTTPFSPDVCPGPLNNGCFRFSLAELASIDTSAPPLRHGNPHPHRSARQQRWLGLQGVLDGVHQIADCFATGNIARDMFIELNRISDVNVSYEAFERALSLVWCVRSRHLQTKHGAPQQERRHTSRLGWTQELEKRIANSHKPYGGQDSIVAVSRAIQCRKAMRIHGFGIGSATERFMIAEAFEFLLGSEDAAPEFERNEAMWSRLDDRALSGRLSSANLENSVVTAMGMIGGMAIQLD